MLFSVLQIFIKNGNRDAAMRIQNRFDISPVALSPAKSTTDWSRLLKESYKMITNGFGQPAANLLIAVSLFISNNVTAGGCVCGHVRMQGDAGSMPMLGQPPSFSA